MFCRIIALGGIISAVLVGILSHVTFRPSNARVRARGGAPDESEATAERKALESAIRFDPFSKTNDQCGSKLTERAAFFPGDFICSPDKRHFFGLADDGDLGIWRGTKKVWSAQTCCADNVSLANLQRDGNLVVYDKGLTALWESATSGPELDGGSITINNSGVVTIRNKSTGKTVALEPWEYTQTQCEVELRGIARWSPGDHICSQDERYQFGLAKDGDLGIWSGPKQIWSAKTCCKGETMAYLQADGNFVVRTEIEVLWQSRTSGDITGSGVVAISNTGTAIITNQDALAQLSITPKLPDAELLLEDLIPEPDADACKRQVPGRIQLQPNEYICSSDGTFRFGVSYQGDLQLLRGPNIEWAAEICCGQDNYVTLQRADGNLVLRSNNQEVLWSSGTNDPLNGDASLTLTNSGVVGITNSAGDRVWAIKATSKNDPCLANDAVEGIDLFEGQFICSSNMRYRFGVIDSTLSLWDGSEMIWSLPSCCGSQDVVARMRRNGNLVVIPVGSDEALWISRTAARDGCRIQVGDTGVASIVSCNGEVLWSTSKGMVEQVNDPAVENEPSTEPTTSPIEKAPRDSPTSCIKSMNGRIQINVGQFICSPNENFRFGVSSDGNLAVLGRNGEVFWSAGTANQGVVHAKLQVDGNLVVSNDEGAIWSSGTVNEHSGEISLQVDEVGVATITCSRNGHIWSSAIADDSGRIEATTLYGKVMAGYQGWFHAEGDGGWDEWIHWSRPYTVPNPNTITIDIWPDLRELDDDELYPTQFRYADGSTAGLYSAYNRKTVERHCRWMYDYGIHGVFAQRFIGLAMRKTDIVDTVLLNLRSGAEKYGRLFVNMYDISGNVGSADERVQDVIKDWMHLVDDLHITSSKQYLHHKGRPLVAIWGFGFQDRLGEARHLQQLIQWFHSDAAPRYRATVMGGVPEGWRDLSRSSKTNQNWATAYRSLDIISPWTIGRMRNMRDVEKWREEYFKPDLSECISLGIDYLPVAYPGFSFHNLYPNRPFNTIPRLGGTFLWHQLYNAVAAGSRMVYIAMFDEVDEATAIFKLAENDSQIPTSGKFLTLDVDPGYAVPNDWYLQLAGRAAKLLSDGRVLPKMMPGIPENIV